MDGKKVLLVDDEVDILEGLKNILEPLGLEVVVASDGLQALQIIRSSQVMFDLIISDLNMPGTDGWKLLEQLEETGAPFRFLIMSGAGIAYPKNGKKDSPETESTSPLLTSLNIIAKPFMTEDFVRKVKSAIEEGG